MNSNPESEWFITIPSTLLRSKSLTDSLKLTLGYLQFRANLEGFTISASDIANRIGVSIPTGVSNVAFLQKHGVLIPAGTKQAKPLKSGKIKEYTVYSINGTRLKEFIQNPNLEASTKEISVEDSTKKISVEPSTKKIVVTMNNNKVHSTINNKYIVTKKMEVEGSTKKLLVENPDQDPMQALREFEASFKAEAVRPVNKEIKISESDWSTISTADFFNPISILKFVRTKWENAEGMTEECFNLRMHQLQDRMGKLFHQDLANYPYIKSEVQDIERKFPIVNVLAGHLAKN